MKPTQAPSLAVVFVFSALAAPTLGCSFFGTTGNGNKVTENRNVAAFTKVHLQLPMRVAIHQGKQISVALTTDSNLAPLVQTAVVGDTLEISSRDNLNMSGKNVVDITMPDFRGVQTDGSGDVDVSGFEEPRDVALKIRGSGDTRYTGNAANLAVSVEGSGDVTLNQGKAARLALNIEGSGNLKAAHYEVHDAAVTIDGSGDADLTVNEGALSATVNGSGDVVWHGTGKATSMATHGSGEISHR